MIGIINSKDCHDITRLIIKIIDLFIEIIAIILNFNKFGDVTNAIPNVYIIIIKS